MKGENNSKNAQKLRSWILENLQLVEQQGKVQYILFLPLGGGCLMMSFFLHLELLVLLLELLLVNVLELELLFPAMEYKPSFPPALVIMAIVTAKLVAMDADTDAGGEEGEGKWFLFSSIPSIFSLRLRRFFFNSVAEEELEIVEEIDWEFVDEVIALPGGVRAGPVEEDDDDDKDGDNFIMLGLVLLASVFFTSVVPA